MDTSRGRASGRRSWTQHLFHGSSRAEDLYELCGENLLIEPSEDALANMGYWRGIDSRRSDGLQLANLALFDRVNAAANIDSNCELVLDVGCGFGLNTIRCQQRYGPHRIVGVNVSTSQLDYARQKAKQARVGDVVHFLRADATKLPFSNESVDRILCTEAAFHFSTRERFFAEAYRVLKPGGALSLADLVALPPRWPWQGPPLRLTRRILAIPTANVYSVETYQAKVLQAGFEVERFRSIREQVYRPFIRWQARQVRGWLGYPIGLKLAVFGFFFCPWDYLELAAVKR